MKILLSGICGRMGKEVERLCRSGYKGAELIMGLDPAGDELDIPVYRSASDIPSLEGVDCIIDFSHHTATLGVLDLALEHSIPVVIATTGHTDGEIKAIRNAAKSIPVFFSANMSLGVALLVEVAKTVAAAMPEADIEIVEKHHNRKLDSPSGTALMLAEELCTVRPDAYINPARNGRGGRDRSEIGIHAIRVGNIVGEHEVIIGTDSQTITLKHEAHDRSLFAEGALTAAKFLVDMPTGLYNMKSLVGNGDRIKNEEFA